MKITLDSYSIVCKLGFRNLILLLTWGLTRPFVGENAWKFEGRGRWVFLSLYFSESLWLFSNSFSVVCHDHSSPVVDWFRQSFQMGASSTVHKYKGKELDKILRCRQHLPNSRLSTKNKTRILIKYKLKDLIRKLNLPNTHIHFKEKYVAENLKPLRAEDKRCAVLPCAVAGLVREVGAQELYGIWGRIVEVGNGGEEIGERKRMNSNRCANPTEPSFFNVQSTPAYPASRDTGMLSYPVFYGIESSFIEVWKITTVAAAAENDGVFTSPEIAKSFDFANEERIYKWWETQGYFQPCFDRGSDPFVVSMPPPNVTGSLHMGHAMFVTLEDIMVRYNRMKGRPTLWLPGTDHAGIATQLVVEKMLAAEGIKRVDLGREEFTKRVWEWKEKYGGTITSQIKRLGASCDWSRERFTLDAQLNRAVVEAFVRLHEKGLIYQGSYMVNWSPNLQTAVSDLEVEYSEEPGALYYIKYRVAGGSRDDYLTIATTRPETLFGDTAVAVNPSDERYSKYIGKLAIVPLTFGRHVPIISDKYVDKDFGTGVLKISPGHDHNDYLLARKLGLPILNVMNKDGTLNDVAGLYSGLDRFEARKKLWADLEETGLAVKKEAYTLRVPRSQRGGEIIEPLVSKQWFVTMEPLAEKALRAVEKGELTIMPERFEKVYKVTSHCTFTDFTFLLFFLLFLFLCFSSFFSGNYIWGLLCGSC
ncbi:hypothetical protein M9H77_10438 [Catharanthus roseus]|uniref:Uncharacterized protein n=1 Tax=Catharanthus roseus TaxID=4058 RepID=A0ACC0BBS8_CATRO|nr:hypothetical protein M9H77_10438 [Catharanthus roseus]